MVDPTLVRTERGTPRRRVGPLVAIVIALCIAGIFGAGLYALMRPNSGATVSTSKITTGAEMPSERAVTPTAGHPHVGALTP